MLAVGGCRLLYWFCIYFIKARRCCCWCCDRRNDRLARNEWLEIDGSFSGRPSTDRTRPPEYYNGPVSTKPLQSGRLFAFSPAATDCWLTHVLTANNPQLPGPGWDIAVIRSTYQLIYVFLYWASSVLQSMLRIVIFNCCCWMTLRIDIRPSGRTQRTINISFDYFSSNFCSFYFVVRDASFGQCSILGGSGPAASKCWWRCYSVGSLRLMIRPAESHRQPLCFCLFFFYPLFLHHLIPILETIPRKKREKISQFESAILKS